MATIPDSFLRGSAPNATLHPIDFATTTPPIPSYKDHFAAIIDDFLTASECKQLLQLAESTTPWERALVNVGNNEQIAAPETRNCDRIIWDSPEIAQRLLDRLTPFLNECDIVRVTNRPLVTGRGPAVREETLVLTRLNERLRFLRYTGGEYFRPHGDGCYVTPDGKERSLYTVHLYLNGEGEQDLKVLRAARDAQKEGEMKAMGGVFARWAERKDNALKGTKGENGEAQSGLLGGATSFSDSMYEDDFDDAVRVFPRTGSVLVFQQRGLYHAGDDVFRGVKYTLRTDIMYKTVG